MVASGVSQGDNNIAASLLHHLNETQSKAHAQCSLLDSKCAACPDMQEWSISKVAVINWVPVTYSMHLFLRCSLSHCSLTSSAPADVMVYAFLLIQLDEFQDVAHAQYRLLHALTCHASSSGLRQRVTIVGDGDQAIYDWRGADVRLFEVRFQPTTMQPVCNPAAEAAVI